MHTSTLVPDMATTGSEFQRWMKEHVLPTIEAVYAHYPVDENGSWGIGYSAILEKAISPLVYWVRDNPGPSSTASVSAFGRGPATPPPVPGPSTLPPKDAVQVVGPEIVVAGVAMDHFVSGDVEVIQPREYLENWKEVASVLGLKWKWDREERAFTRPIQG